MQNVVDRNTIHEGSEKSLNIGFCNSRLIPKCGRMTTIEILFGAILDESDEIFGIRIFDFGIEIELISLEKLENDTNFS